MGEKKSVHRVVVGEPRGRHHLEHPGVDGRILRCIFRNWDWEHGLE
jgi:hypothetical protein